MIPTNKLTLKLEEVISPIFENTLNNDTENQQLATLRNWLLPMLMNGQALVD